MYGRDISDLAKSLYTGFVDGSIVSNDEYQPRLLVNNADVGEKVLTCITRELRRCEEFMFSVAFVTRSGVVTLLNTLKELEAEGVRGVVISSQYQNFTQPNALRDLLRFRNIELRIVTEGNLHSKGYLFRKGDMYSLIVGSSNLTQNALCENKEWNLKVSSSVHGTLAKGTLAEFERIRSDSTLVDAAWIDAYEHIYHANPRWGIRKESDVVYPERVDAAEGAAIPRILPIPPVIHPNAMQRDALLALQNVRNGGKRRAILISATGTGKTYLSAFDVLSMNPGRFLFVVHRENIARAAMESFRKVVGHQSTYGILSGSGYAQKSGAQFLFATIQTISKEENYRAFQPDCFDYIVIDEVHRSGAVSYQKIISYFQPRFMLGMTATPERTDGTNIYEMFDNTIAYEIRLRQAMREHMICPFHYFGVTEILIDGIPIDDVTDFRRLTSEVRVDNIVEKIGFYGYSGNRVRGLVFCSRREEAKVLSDLFNLRGFRTVALVGENSEDDRERAIERIEQHDPENGLDYIFTVDIFNEGVDIPSINQVVMLRPTESAILFVQQLGRGLRKTMAKEYVVIIDFIGNYRKNFMIPIALSGDQSYNKDSIRRFVAEGNRTIPGCSTVHFDAISRQRIYEAIDAANFQDTALIKESYRQLKFRLGRIPSMMDFEQYDAIDLMRVIDKFGSYHAFLKKHEKEYSVWFSENEAGAVSFISEKFASGKRIHELVFLELLFNGSKNLLQDFSETMIREYGIIIQEKTLRSLLNIFTNNFLTGSGKNAYPSSVFVSDISLGNNGGERSVDTLTASVESGILSLRARPSALFCVMCGNPVWRDQMLEIIQFGKGRWRANYANRYDDTNFCLYQKYTYEDVCRLLDWEKAEVALNIGGYKFDKKTKTYPVFINYHKDEEVSDSIRYEDRFQSPNSLVALSKSGRTPESEDVLQAYRAEEDGVSMHLFVRRNKDDKISKEFYYLGKMRAEGKPKPILMKNTNKNAVEINYQLNVPVREDIYDFITHGSDEGSS